MSVSLSAVVICRDEESNIEACLRSLQFCDERVVVDSGSSDATVEIASRWAEHVYQREFFSHAEQKNWAMEQTDTDWILIVTKMIVIVDWVLIRLAP